MISEHFFLKKMSTTTKIFVLTLDQISLPNYTNFFKLTEKNYMLWKSQILPVIIGGNLKGFINGHIQELDMEILTQIKTSKGADSSASQ